MDRLFASNQPQNYYTGVTSSTVDKSGNVTNYYRSGDTTNTNIIDSYNKTFNTIYNTTNNTTTNKYNANVKLENFLNQYTTNNVTTNNTYSANFKSWYYDNTTNNYNYNEFNKYDTTNNYLYYNQDNSRYYISIDNSTDEYYLIDVQYSPTFVTVNYTYNTTNINNTENVGDVTNVYYFELTDGRNSSTLTADEVAGMVFGYDVVNYELVTDDPNTLSLQHFDGNYTDSSSYNRTFYSQNRSNNYVDSGAFGKAVTLPSGAAAGVTIPGLSGYSSLSFDFRVYFNDISSLGIYFGDTNIFQEIVAGTRIWKGKDIYSDNNSNKISKLSSGGTYNFAYVTQPVAINQYYTLEYLKSIEDTANLYVFAPLSQTLTSKFTVPTSVFSAGYEGESAYSKKYGWMSSSSLAPSLYSSSVYAGIYVTSYRVLDRTGWQAVEGTIRHYSDYEYRWSPSKYVLADFSYDTYRN